MSLLKELDMMRFRNEEVNFDVRYEDHQSPQNAHKIYF